LILSTWDDKTWMVLSILIPNQIRSGSASHDTQEDVLIQIDMTFDTDFHDPRFSLVLKYGDLVTISTQTRHSLMFMISFYSFSSVKMDAVSMNIVSIDITNRLQYISCV
jgi:hypothetical protein